MWWVRGVCGECLSVVEKLLENFLVVFGRIFNAYCHIHLLQVGPIVGAFYVSLDVFPSFLCVVAFLFLGCVLWV